MERLVASDGSTTDWERGQVRKARALLRRRLRRARHNGDFAFTPGHLARRLKRGLNEGSITEKEAAKMRAIQARIKALARGAQADGVVTQQERARVWRAQKKLGVALNQARRFGPLRRALGTNGFRQALKRGLERGSLTRREARFMRFAHGRVVAIRRQISADGRITPREIARLRDARRRFGRAAHTEHRNADRSGAHRQQARARGNGRGYGRGAARAAQRSAQRYGRAVGRGMRSVGKIFGGR